MHDAACDQDIGDQHLGAVDEDVAVHDCDHEVGAEKGGDAGAVFKGGAIGHGAVDHCRVR